MVSIMFALCWRTCAHVGRHACRLEIFPFVALALSSRYASFEDETVPKFMYGTHYSSAGVVLHYLVRQDPFTTLHINLQVDKKHDVGSRYVLFPRVA